MNDNHYGTVVNYFGYGNGGNAECIGNKWTNIMMKKKLDF